MKFYEYRFVNSSGTITMREIAQAAKVAVSTVSKALRNDPSISESRCREIQKLADELGYHPNPLVSMLMAQLHHHRRRSDPHNIAWIDLWKGDERREGAMNAHLLLQGARERAAELGYSIEIHHAAKDRITPEQLVRRLVVKGEWGVIIPPVPEIFRSFPIDLRGLAAVTIGTSLQQPVMHRASPNHFQGCLLAFGQLHRIGCHRIGLALSASMNERVEGKWLGAFHSIQSSHKTSDRIKPLIIPAHKDKEAVLAQWILKEQPEVMLLAEDYDWRRVLGLLKSFGLKSPIIPSVGWLMLPESNKRNPFKELGGLDYRPEQLGRVALEMVVAQIHRNERGEALIPQTVQINAVWRERLLSSIF